MRSIDFLTGSISKNISQYSLPWLLALALGPLGCMTPSVLGADGGAKTRSTAVKKLCEHLGIGEGKVVADVGCGNGVDTLVFSEVVGSCGTVFAEDIGASDLQSLVKKTRQPKWGNIVPVLGHTEDPRLPNGQMDMVYTHFVFHHFAQPQQMLRHLWFDIKPGGCLVVIDQKKGPLREWVDNEGREDKHTWTGETTVVRLARETGFQFDGIAEDFWFEKDPFVLVFRKPKDSIQPKGDPDLPPALDAAACLDVLPLPAIDNAHVLFAGLDRGRAMLPALRQKLKSSVLIDDVVLDEWAVSKAELPEGSTNATSVLRTINGDLPTLTERNLHLIIFADAYHRLWEPGKLLNRLKQTIRSDGYVAVIDRTGPAGESRRIAGHKRHIAPDQVREDMKKAGFESVQETNLSAQERFLLLFKVSASDR